MFELLDLVSLNEDEGQELVQSKFSPESPEEFVRKCQDLLRAAYPKLKVIIPSYGESLINDAALTRQVRADTAAVLHLDNV